MLLDYSRRKFSKGGAWRDLISRRPSLSIGEYDFEVLQSDFRKQHEEDYWCWYVAKWCLISDTILHEAPCPPPDDDPEVPGEYVWDVWADYTGQLRCGFVQRFLVKSRCMPHDDPACKICQAAGAWIPPTEVTDRGRT